MDKDKTTKFSIPEAVQESLSKVHEGQFDLEDYLENSDQYEETLAALDEQSNNQGIKIHRNLMEDCREAFDLALADFKHEKPNYTLAQLTNEVVERLESDTHGGHRFDLDRGKIQDVKGWVEGWIPKKKGNSGELVKLRYWNKEKFVAPYLLISSSLFGCGLDKKRGRKLLEGERLATWGRNSFVEYSGAELVQGDLSVWVELVRLAIDQNRNDGVRDLIHNDTNTIKFIENKPTVPVQFSGRKMLELLGKSSNGNNHLWLGRVITRLKVGCLMIRQPLEGNKWRDVSGEFVKDIDRLGETIQEWKVNPRTGEKEVHYKETGDYRCYLNLDLVRLYRNGFVEFKKESRQALKAHEQWLQLFITWQSPRQVKYVPERNLAALMRLEETASTVFRDRVAKAMEALAATGLVTSPRKKVRNRKGKMVYPWFKRNGTGKYTLEFIHTPTPQLK